MAKRSSSPDKLTIKGLSAEDQKWLQEESDRLGCDPENLVRMMIRQRSAPTPPQPPRGGGVRYEPITPTMSYTYPDDAVDAAVESDTPTINQAEPSLDEVMSAPPSFLEEPRPRPVPRSAPYVNPTRNIVPMRRHYGGGAFGAGSMTAPAGPSERASGNMMGDGVGNVMRDNMRHFGFGSPRNR